MGGCLIGPFFTSCLLFCLLLYQGICTYTNCMYTFDEYDGEQVMTASYLVLILAPWTNLYRRSHKYVHSAMEH
jgi:hypothetical protein